jgi:hypothetical protein
MTILGLKNLSGCFPIRLHTLLLSVNDNTTKLITHTILTYTTPGVFY